MPGLALSNGAVATYGAAASTTTSLVFTTTVASGQDSSNLSVMGISLNGASITGIGTTYASGDTTGTQALDTTGLALDTGLVIDTIAPAFNVTQIIANTPYPTLAGTSEAGAVITLSLNGSTLGNVTTGSDGTWNFTSSTALAAGTYQIQVNATDSAVRAIPPPPRPYP